MKIKLTKKLIIIIILLGIILTGAYFVLGNTGRSGPEAAPNLEEYGLVGHWTFEEGSGQTISDRSGNGNDGTLGANSSVGKDDPVFVAGHDSSGPGGMGMSFDGVDDYVEGNFTAGALANFTLSVWLQYKTGNPVNGGVVGFQTDVENRFGFDISGSSSTEAVTFEVEYGNTKYNAYTANNELTINKWHLVTGVFSGGNTSKIYVDGIDKTSNGGVSTAVAPDSKYNFGINNSANFVGTIDDVRIYNRALSADEIRMLYNRKKPVMELKFDEGSGTTAYDESFNNNDVTFPAADGNKPEWAAP